MNTVSEFLSTILGFFAVIFMIAAFSAKYLGSHVSCYLCLFFHFVLVISALPLIVRALFILETTSPNFQIFLTLMSVIHSILLFLIGLETPPLSAAFTVAAILELLPLILIIFRAYFQAMQDTDYLYIQYLPRNLY